MIHSFKVTFGAKYLTGIVTSVPHYEIVSLIKNNILHRSKNVLSYVFKRNFFVKMKLRSDGLYNFLRKLSLVWIKFNIQRTRFNCY